MNLPPAVWFLLARLGGVVLLGALVGALLGSLIGGIALALAAALGWQLMNLFWLDGWLRDRANRSPPDVSGVWGDVVSQVVRLHRRKRFHKQRLLELFRELRRSTAAMPDGVIILNAQWEIVWFNRTAGRLLGLRRRVDDGMALTNLIREPSLARYLQQGEFAEPHVLARGEPRVHLSFQVVPYGREQRLMLVRDVSRQVALESMRKDFVANASHELRSPLTVVTGYVETLLQDDALDPALRAPLTEMQRQTQRMNGIVSDLLDLSRLDANEREVQGEPIDVVALCAVLRKDILARASHPEVQLDMASDAKLLGDPAEVLSAFSNLADNAAKYTPHTGRVRLRWSIDADGSARFEVEDTGPGIAPEHLPRLTERFYRVDEGRSRDAGGSGLGLAIVKHVLQHHGAALDVQSTPGVGSRFSCVFPSRRVIGGARGENLPPAIRTA
ncbi:MAG: phosphate regulon sensor histidine kinase PhoR [Proteobacteria bacterium]|jgi:two-component system, OmpR family, phosphate regulon sensor histidine kinase PhoR|nr:phosphate regulon sensor histidine kinase PhoR [Pseudomonadota bacterium]MBK9251038.1 phosphate regulon sensor histidine kinase PhoR [Pseudomonadota bacterium]